MTTFNTGNPLGSTDVYDRYDNSENLDNFSNGPLDAYADRLGVMRQSLQGIRNASQYVILGPYGPGLNFTAKNEVFSYLGEFYAPGPSITLPYTTTGAGAGEIANFRSVGDAVLRADLADPTDGAGIVALDTKENYPADSVGRAINGVDQPEAQFAVPTGPSIRRQRTTTQSLDIFVDASASPGGDGSQLAPYQSINRALEDVPREIYHKVRIYIADGVYVGADNSWNLFNYWVSPVSVAGFQIIGHVPENPLYADTNIAAVVLGDASGANTTSNFVIGGVQGDADDTKMIGVTVDGRVQVYGGLFAFDRCAFKTGRNGNLIDGHSGRVKLTSCDLSDCANGISATDLAAFFLASCTGASLTTSVYSVSNGSLLSTELCTALNALNITTVEGNSIVKLEGRFLTLNTSQNAWGVARSDDGAVLLSTNNVGDSIAKGAIAGGLYPTGGLTLPTNDTFGIYGVANGDLYVKVDLAGVEKILKIYTYATNTWV